MLGTVGATGGVVGARGGREMTGPWPTVAHGAAGIFSTIGVAVGAHRSAFEHAFSIHSVCIGIGVNISTRVGVYHQGRAKWVWGRLL